MRFKDKVVLVTGGGQGLGEAFCKGFVREGAHVVIIDINEQNGKEVERALGEKAVFMKTDVSSRSQVQATVDAVMERFGRIDVLVNNAGIHSGGQFWEETEEAWQRMFEVNIMGVVLISQIVVPIMIKQKKGKIINVSSKAAVVGEPNHAAYSASKGAVMSLTRAAANGSISTSRSPSARGISSFNASAVPTGPVRTMCSSI